MKPIKIEGKRLYLRLIDPHDAELITKWKRDPFIKRNANSISAVINLEEQKEDIQNSIQSKTDWYFIIVKKDSNRPIGYVRINVFNSNKNAWLRFALGEERGYGHSYEALKILIQKLFRIGFHRIEAEVYSFNNTSSRVLEKIGFKLEGIKREAHYDENKCYDVKCFGLLEHDFRKNNK